MRNLNIWSGASLACAALSVLSSRVRIATFAAVFSFTPVVAMAQAADELSQRVIVKWRTPTAMAEQSSVASRALGDVEAQLGVATESVRVMATRAEVLRLKRRMTPAELRDFIAALAANPSVEYVEEDRRMYAVLTPNDTRFSEQWHYYESTGGLNLPPAWDITTGTGVTVGVIDTGYRPHADLAANIVGGFDFISDVATANDGNGRDSDARDPGDWSTAGQCGGGPARNSSWHGTHVAGTIAALTNNSNGVAGVAFGARVLPLRALGRCGGFTSDIADAIIWGSGGTVSGVPANANPARVLNLSLGGGGACGITTQTAVNSARSRGTVVVVAAGNSNQNAANFSPANCNGVIAVAATARNGGKAPYSNFGAIVDVAAPGGSTSSGAANGVLSTLNTGATTPGADAYAFYQGTSMASPHTAGVVALMLSRNGALTPDDVETRLRNSTRAFPGTCNQCGTGIVNALAAVNAAGGGGGGGGGTVLQNGVPVPNLSGATGSERRFTMNVPAGASNLQFRISGGTGDADVYVRFGSPPTTSAFNCRPFLNGNNETCTFAVPQTGVYHVMIRGFTPYSGVTLRGSFQ